jgi:hypothetical protein
MKAARAGDPRGPPEQRTKTQRAALVWTNTYFGRIDVLSATCLQADAPGEQNGRHQYAGCGRHDVLENMERGQRQPK